MIQHCPSCGKEYRSVNKITVFGCCSHKTRKTVDGYLVKIEKPVGKRYEPPLPKPDTSNQPGSVLYRLLRDTFSIKPKPGCGCYALRDEMDRLGVDGCEAEFVRLVDKLKENATKYTWVESFGSAVNAIRNGALNWLNPFHPWESMLRHAIELSKGLQRAELDNSQAGPKRQ